jgi:hypothetical protein
MLDTAAERVLTRLRRRYPRYAEPAYLFMLQALHHRMHQLETPRHLSGSELADGVRELALLRFGPMARRVFTRSTKRSRNENLEVAASRSAFCVVRVARREHGWLGPGGWSGSVTMVVH